MNLRNGKKYEIKCKCQKWYPNPNFDSLCSRCYSVNYPEAWRKFREANWCPADHIPQEILEQFITNNKTIFPGCQWHMLKTSIKDETNFGLLITLLNYIKRNNRGCLGITAKQGAELYKTFKEVHSDKYEGNMGGKSDWRWQHLFAGMIFDTWNIKTDEHGPIAYCYYSNFGAKPRGQMITGQCVSPWMNFSQKKREVWLKSLPEGFAIVIN